MDKIRITFAGGSDEDRAVFNGLLAAWTFTDEQGFGLLPVASSAERLALACEVNEAFRGLRHEVGPGRYSLAPQGGTMELSRGAFDLLREFWRAYCPRLGTRFAETVRTINNRLDAAVGSV